MVGFKIEFKNLCKCSPRRELLGIVIFVKYLGHYLKGKKFLVRTYGSLRWLFRFKEPEEQIARWLEVILSIEQVGYTVTLMRSQGFPASNVAYRTYQLKFL